MTHPTRPDDMVAAAPALGEALLREAVPVEPPDTVRTRLRARILREAEPIAPLVASAAFTTLFAADAPWTPVTDKVQVKVLGDSDGIRYLLYRMQPGGELPPHDHNGEEESVVLQGSVDIGPLHCREGDCHVARVGSQHPVVRSETGALFFARRVLAGARPHAM